MVYSDQFTAERDKLILAFTRGLLDASIDEAARRLAIPRKAPPVNQPDSVTGLDASRTIYVDRISGEPQTVALKPGWYGSQAGITGYTEAEVLYFPSSLTFIPWTNITNTHH